MMRGLVSRKKVDKVFTEEIKQLEELRSDSYLWTDLTEEERDRVQTECEQRISLLKKVEGRILTE